MVGDPISISLSARRHSTAKHRHLTPHFTAARHQAEMFAVAGSLGGWGLDLGSQEEDMDDGLVSFRAVLVAFSSWRNKKIVPARTLDLRGCRVTG